ncbi:MAG: hypothetical protein ACRDKH_03440 [Solirubrobacterales bacterium]
MPRLRILAALIAALALALPATTAGGAPTATTSGEELGTYLDTGKLKLRKRLNYLIACGAPAGQLCQLEVENKLKLKGPDLGPLRTSGIFAGGQTVEVFIQLNKGARVAAKRNIGAAKVKSSLTATNLTTGEVDVDEQTFRLKK